MKILLLFPFLLFAQFSPRSQIQPKIDACVGKIVEPVNPILKRGSLFWCKKVYPTEVCYDTSPPFSCFYYKFLPYETRTACLTAVPSNLPPTARPLPQCSSLECPDGSIRKTNPAEVICTGELLAEDKVLKQMYDAQIADKQLILERWKELEVSLHLEAYCQYYHHRPCVKIPEDVKKALSINVAAILELSPSKLMDIMNNPRNR